MFGIAGADVRPLSVVSIVVPTAAFAACVVPARRAARVNPAVTLRGE